MGFFDDDGFDNMVREMFQGRASKRAPSNNAKTPKNQVITKKNVFLIYDFSGYEKINVEIKDEEVVNDYNETVHTGRKAVVVSAEDKTIGNYPLEKEIKIKGFEWTFNNGVLEVVFRR